MIVRVYDCIKCIDPALCSARRHQSEEARFQCAIQAHRTRRLLVALACEMRNAMSVHERRKARIKILLTLVGL